MIWSTPLALAALILVPLLIGLYVWRARKPKPSVLLPSASNMKPLMSSGHRQLRHLPMLLRSLAIIFLVLAIARPRTLLEEANINTEGIDIVIALDISTSMLAEDLQPNRLEAAKSVAEDFILGRTSDRIGLVMFAGEAFTWAPLTLDYEVVSELMSKVQAGTVEDGTAIGKAIATGTNRLRHGGGKSKVLILLTDGVNNVDQPDPLTAAGAAAGLGVKVYTIGVGTQGTARAPVQTPAGVRYRRVQVEIDEELLTKIAETTGGRYFRATSTEALKAIYDRIDELERTKVEVEHVRHWRERFYPFAALAFLLLVIERLLVLTRLRNIAV